jgi:protein-S-isoprenylcysteine O-methyltransferase Ste14
MKPIPRIALVIGSTAVYFGLAILGWGGVAAFFSHPAFVALAAATTVMVVVAYIAGGNVSPGVHEDRSNRWVLGAFGVIGLLSGFFPAYTDRIGFWIIDGETIRWLGIALYVVGGTVRLWPVFVLGHRFSGLVAIQPGHKLVTEGIYGVIRHPSYLGCSSTRSAGDWLFALELACSSWWLCYPRWLLASARKKRCCGRSLATSTRPIAGEPRV